MLTVRIIYNDNTEDIKEVLEIADICLDGVKSINIIRDESKKAA